MFLCVAEEIVFLTYNIFLLCSIHKLKNGNYFKEEQPLHETATHTGTQILVCSTYCSTAALQNNVTFYVHVFQKLNQTDRQPDSQILLYDILKTLFFKHYKMILNVIVSPTHLYIIIQI